MSLIKYRTERNGTSIKSIEIDRETDVSIWIGGRRSDKQTSWYCYYSTWEEAKDALFKRAESNLSHARRQLEQAQSFYGNVVGLKNPEMGNKN